MKKFLAVFILSALMAVPSFAGDVVGRSVVAVGKESGKVVAVMAKDTAKAVTAVAKFLF